MRAWLFAAVRRGSGWLRLGLWGYSLYLLLDLWTQLGGTVEESLRWWARLGLGCGTVVGWTAGDYARELAGWGTGRSHARLLRWFWGPPAILAALLMLHQKHAGLPDEVRTTFGLLLAYCAGFDAAIAAWPLACGRPYRYFEEIPPEQPSETTPTRDPPFRY